MNWSETVRHVMSAQPVSIEVTAPPSELQRLLTNNAFHHLPVLDEGVLVGIVSAIDLARVSLGAWVKDADTETAWLDNQFKIKDLMTWEPEFVRVDDPLRVVVDKLAEGAFHSLPVLEHDGQLAGIVTSTDVLRYIATAR